VRSVGHRLLAAGHDDLELARRISWSARAMASMPERHTLLMVRAGTVIGIPALTAA
jgi:hypothetical protein